MSRNKDMVNVDEIEKGGSGTTGGCRECLTKRSRDL